MNIKKHIAQKLSPSGKVILKKPRLLTEAERKEKTKNWPSSGNAISQKEQAGRHEENLAYQKKHKKAWSE